MNFAESGSSSGKITKAEKENAFRKTGVWSNRFIISAIVQGTVITGLTLSFIIAQALASGIINIIEFLSLSFEGPAKWFFLGYIFYLILVVAIAVTAVFYNHLESNMGRQIGSFRSVLAWIHLVGMNVGGAAATISMIFAGLVGSGILNAAIIIVGGAGSGSAANEYAQLQPNIAAMEQFIAPIAAFVGLLAVGVIAGGIVYITTYLQKNSLQ